ncbi:hypothetical protein F5X68DRAFT_75760 [Plectosphaerella plurivora]|uniref:Uncharacterized protein n=1 Tax=Plectosphaerella plurivora TaxID=936078 RepID=A0A9P8VEQ3_9PEZI|nr:hypothetical protein F5X68DRAFT_75760 [Plectosphaerella plurivora]
MRRNATLRNARRNLQLFSGPQPRRCSSLLATHGARHAFTRPLFLAYYRGMHYRPNIATKLDLQYTIRRGHRGTSLPPDPDARRFFTTIWPAPPLQPRLLCYKCLPTTRLLTDFWTTNRNARNRWRVTSSRRPGRVMVSCSASPKTWDRTRAHSRNLNNKGLFFTPGRRPPPPCLVLPCPESLACPVHTGRANRPAPEISDVKPPVEKRKQCRQGTTNQGMENKNPSEVLRLPHNRLLGNPPWHPSVCAEARPVRP